MKKKYIKWLQYLAAFIVILFIIFPIYWIVINSFRPYSEFITRNPALWPEQWTLQNYINVFKVGKFGKYIVNSFIYTGFTVLFTLTIGCLASYALSFFPKFRLKKFILTSLLVFQMLPTLVMTIALFVVFWKLGILNTYFSMILAYTCASGGTGVAIIMLNGYFQEVPAELFESANIDGANTFQAFCKILLPLAIPGIICVAIYTFILTWQEFTFAQNLITDQQMYNVSVGLTAFSQERGKDWSAIMAASTLIMVPTLIMFTTIQNYFIDNLSGAVKE